MSKKCLMLIADGLGDRPIPQLGGKTPLEYAKTPTMDQLASNGMTGLIHPYKPGARCGTDWGHLCLFGYDPAEYYTGRGSIEAFSAGLELEPGDIAFRGNFATVDESFHVIDRRAGRISNKTEIDTLLSEIHGLEIDGYQLLVKSLTEHRLAVVLRGKGLGSQIPDVDPGTACEGKPIIRLESLSFAQEEDARTANILWHFLQKVHKIWNNSPVNNARIAKGLLPVNFILTRGSGKAMVVPPFTEKFPQARVAVIAGDATITGIGRMCGFDSFTQPSFTGGFTTDYMGKARLALDLLGTHDLVIVYIKGTDLCGHDNLPLKKAEIIENIDQIFDYWLSHEKNDDYYYAMIADHSTPCCRRDHSADPVPAFLSGKDVRVDQTNFYGERSCSNGILNHYTGAEFMETIMDYLWFSKKFGA